MIRSENHVPEWQQSSASILSKLILITKTNRRVSEYGKRKTNTDAVKLVHVSSKIHVRGRRGERFHHARHPGQIKKSNGTRPVQCDALYIQISRRSRKSKKEVSGE